SSGVFGGIIRQELQRDRAVQTRVLGLVHDAHATAPELARDLVVRNCPADHSNVILGGATGAVNRQYGFRRWEVCGGSDNSRRVALGCYAIGLLYALLALTQRSYLLNRIALPAMSLGMVFQFVSLSESVLVGGPVTITLVHNSESFLALLVMAAFMIVYLVYRTTSPGIVVFPLVFLLSFVAATGQQPFLLTSPGLRRGWLVAHIALIFTGYAALFLS